MKKAYFTLRELNSDESPNIGTVSAMIKGADIVNDVTVELLVKEALRKHFDAEPVDVSGLDLSKAYMAYPFDVEITLEENGEQFKRKIEIEQTWLYS